MEENNNVNEPNENIQNVNKEETNQENAIQLNSKIKKIKK